MSSRIPIVIIGGYLGAGKTTLINACLQNGLKNAAIIVNDFGDINIDAALISQFSSDTVELSNGCICCSIGESLADTLFSILDRPQLPDLIVIETSGVSDPSSVAAYTYMNGVTNAGVLVLVDAPSAVNTFNQSLLQKTFERQIRSAHVLAITKSDIASDEEIVAVKELLQHLAPDTPVILATPESLSLVVDIPTETRSVVSETDVDHPFVQHIHQFENPVTSEELTEFLASLDESIIRVKGAVQLADSTVVLVQKTGRHLSITSTTLPSNWIGRSRHEVAFGEHHKGGFVERQVDICVVGAGFAGMYTIVRARQMGMSVVVFEAGTDVGGTWYWNRYPGARCDIESVEYSYSFDEELQQEWNWTERYAAQPEILKYAQHVAERFDLRSDIQFSTRVVSAHFNESNSRWFTTTDQGDVVQSRFIVFATGCLSSANRPQFEGADSFAGATYHTGEWPHEGVDFTGKTVGLIGTGSSAIQSIPLIAEQADHLTVFQRTASFSIPARNDTIDEEYVQRVKKNYKAFRDANRLQTGAFGSTIERGENSALEASDAERRKEFERRWAKGGFGFLSSYNDFLLKKEANDTVADFVREKIRATVQNPEIAEALLPQQVIGCKRLCLDTNYYETFNRDNVSLVPVDKHPIERITENGLVVNGKEHTFDVLVYATGFDAMTGSLLKIDIRGRDGKTLREAWEAGPVTYLGLNTAGFPNMFMVSGPGSPSVLTNMIMSIEQHVEWITDCIGFMAKSGKTVIETTEESQASWVAFVNAVADMTLYPSCNSWYLGANVPGKPRVFMPLIGFPTYVQKCDEVVRNGYEGFMLS